ncbi:hypothetical protein [Jiella sp. M17.18]|uniref:hypothetical protein n=1 Tax=Jiella sp. M17.18 TaxID=3234247 RepID=UPI0034DFFE2A
MRLDVFRGKRPRDKHSRFKIKRRLFIALLFLSLLAGWIAIGLLLPWFDTTFSTPSLSLFETRSPPRFAALPAPFPSLRAL